MDVENEIQRLRDRSHDQNNHVQELIAKLGSMDGKMDAIHLSLKEDLLEIKTETAKTNGRVSGHDKAIARMQGGIAAGIAGTPFVLFALSRLIH